MADDTRDSVKDLNRRFTDHVDSVRKELDSLHEKDQLINSVVQKISEEQTEFRYEFRLHDAREKDYRNSQTKLFESWLNVVQDLQGAFTRFEDRLETVIAQQAADTKTIEPIKGFKNWVIFSLKIAGVISGFAGAMTAIQIAIKNNVFSIFG